MNVRFEWKCSYQNEVEYAVHGHNVRSIEAFSECKFGLLEYQRSTCNYTSEEFELIMVARQGGAVIRYTASPYISTEHYWAERRWSPEFYAAFVQHLNDSHEAYIAEHERRRIARGWTLEEFPIEPMQAVPRPIYYDPETKGYKVEPWFTPVFSPTEVVALRLMGCGTV
jgi:hypothetical protein